jgi:hypothetical protein
MSKYCLIKDNTPQNFLNGGMDMGEKKTTTRWRPNFFDIVIVAVLAAVAVLLFTIIRGTGDTGGILFAGTQEPVYYTIELQAMRGDSGELIEPGDSLIDRVENRPLGTVVSVELRPAQMLSRDLNTGDFIISEIPERTDAVIVVRAMATITDTQINIGRFTLRAGTRVSVLGPMYHGTGFVVDIERGDR